MNRNVLLTWVIPMVAAAPLAWSQSGPAGTRPDAMDAKTVVPLATYESPFNGYRPFSEEKVAPWKDTNDTVGRIGGWRAYAKEAAPPKPDAGSDPSGATQPGPAGHDGHKR